VLNEGEGEAAPNGAGFAGGPRVKADLDEIVAKVEELGIPVGTLGVEGWHKVLDEEGPAARAYFAGLRKRGFRLSAYWNPFTSPAGKGFASAAERGLFIRDPAGAPYPIVTNRFGVSNVIDFTHPGAAGWWKEQIDRSADLGFEGFMEDFGELVTEGMTFADGTPTELAHNAYPTAYHRAGRAAIDQQARERPGFEPWFYVRAGHTGTSASTGGVFPGDETTDWSIGSGLPSVVPALLNHALGGSPTFTTDVGGYLDLTAPRTTPELLIRWSQLAAFTPISRIHNSTGKGTLLPWEAGPAAVDAYRRYARAKVRLAPMMDRWTRRAAADGTIGPVRPLLLDEPGPVAAAVGDQWRVGHDLLVAPILRRGATSRSVYLPAGDRWERVRVAEDGTLTGHGTLLPGGTRVSAAAPLSDIPLFRRAVRLRLTRRCTGAGRLRVQVEGDTGSVLAQATRLGGRVVSRGRTVTLSRRTLERTRARALRARLELEDGRVLRLRRPLPSCGLAR
jgi:alpha-glucosidase (family GH31 glycosyl hydrolase)